MRIHSLKDGRCQLCPHDDRPKNWWTCAHCGHINQPLLRRRGEPHVMIYSCAVCGKERTI